MKCEICKNPIKKEDNYLRITDYLKGKFFGEAFYHTLCFNDKIKNAITMNKQVLKKKLEGMITKVRGMQYAS